MSPRAVNMLIIKRAQTCCGAYMHTRTQFNIYKKHLFITSVSGDETGGMNKFAAHRPPGTQTSPCF